MTVVESLPVLRYALVPIEHTFILLALAWIQLAVELDVLTGGWQPFPWCDMLLFFPALQKLKQLTLSRVEDGVNVPGGMSR